MKSHLLPPMEACRMLKSEYTMCPKNDHLRKLMKKILISFELHVKSDQIVRQKPQSVNQLAFEILLRGVQHGTAATCPDVD